MRGIRRTARLIPPLLRSGPNTTANPAVPTSVARKVALQIHWILGTSMHQNPVTSMAADASTNNEYSPTTRSKRTDARAWRDVVSVRGQASRP